MDRHTVNAALRPGGIHACKAVAALSCKTADIALLRTSTTVGNARTVGLAAGPHLANLACFTVLIAEWAAAWQVTGLRDRGIFKAGGFINGLVLLEHPPTDSATCSTTILHITLCRAIAKSSTAIARARVGRYVLKLYP
jgi:hypothetical protein